jgi:hypothetical protein
MAISIKKIKKRSLVNKITINSDVHFKTVKTLLKEHLCLLRDLHIHRYKFFVSYGLNELKKKEIKSVFFVRNGVVLKSISKNETKKYNIQPYNVVLFLEHINLSVVKDLKNNFENLRF